MHDDDDDNGVIDRIDEPFDRSFCFLITNYKKNFLEMQLKDIAHSLTDSTIILLLYIRRTCIYHFSVQPPTRHY